MTMLFEYTLQYVDQGGKKGRMSYIAATIGEIMGVEAKAEVGNIIGKIMFYNEIYTS